ncbi:aminoglycoside phosphotransferase family protein [Egbenema bharatensis]|uniref:aminoglycoside phosphotransferase family protein n=1 Tax=Egbenema bharatensis TaxID=3463334 RepID=UPI003A8796DF
MLSPADLHLIRRDPDLPGLRYLLCADIFAEKLMAKLPNISISQIRKTYIRHKPATNCLVSYELNIAGTHTSIYAKAVASTSIDKLKKYQQRADVPGALGTGRIILLPEKIIVSAFPNDNRLRQLPTLIDPTLRQKRLQKILPDCSELWTGTLHSLRYKPERRYVAQLQVKGQPQAIIKAYTNYSFRQVKANSKTFQSIDQVNIPSLIGHSRPNQLLIYPWVSGQSLHELITTSSLNEDIGIQTGAALAQIHQQNPKRLLNLTRTDEATTLLTVAANLSWLCPQWKHRIQTIAVQLAAALLSTPSPGIPIHGDFNAEQVIVHANGITFIDFDRAVRGDPMADLGSFVAKLHWSELCQILSAERREQLTSMLIAGYRDVAPERIDDEQIQRYTAIGLLRLAADPFRYCDPDWLNKIGLIIQRIEDLVMESCLSTAQIA